MGAIAFPTTVVGPSTPLSDCTMYYLKVAAVQDGNTGPYSNIHRFYVNEQGTCFPPPIGKANQNVFCKIGPDWDISSYLFENGDTVMVVGRNANSSQIQVLVPDENGEPKDPPEYCWIPLGAMTPFDHQNLPIKVPPAAPISNDGGGSAPLVCNESMPPDMCIAAGGTSKLKQPGCDCP